MKVVVNWSRCDGNGNCAAEAPEIFALDESDTLTVLKEEIPPALQPKAKAAVRACPKRALKLSGDNNG